MSETGGNKLPINFDTDTTLQPEDVHTVSTTAQEQDILKVFPALETPPGEERDSLRDYLPQHKPPA